MSKLYLLSRSLILSLYTLYDILYTSLGKGNSLDIAASNLIALDNLSSSSVNVVFNDAAS